VGLHAMRDRAHAVGANFTIESTPGGSVIRLTLPNRRRRPT